MITFKSDSKHKPNQLAWEYFDDFYLNFEWNQLVGETKKIANDIKQSENQIKISF